MARIIDVVEFPDAKGNEIVHREPPVGAGDIRLGSQLIVRESQAAVFFRDGKALDVFGPGRHTLTTANIPLLSRLIGLVTNSRNPFPAEVVFVNMKQFIDQKWGTPEPIAFADPVFMMARLRAFGTYSFQVKDPSLFVNTIVGQQGLFTTQDVQNHLRSMIVQRFLDFLGELKRSLLELPSLYNEISAGTRAMLADDFNAIGLNLMAIYVNAVTPTEETSKAIEQRSAMGAMLYGMGDSDVARYQRLQAAQAMVDAANNPSGDAGTGVGLGAGMALGAQMAGMMNQAQQQPQPTSPAPPAAPVAPTESPAAPAQAAATPAGPLNREQVKQAMDSLDLRFSMGEISEETYNRMMKRWEEKLKELGG